MLALELIDAGLVLAQRSGEATALLSDTPGIAVLEDAVTLTGAAAAARIRLRPLLAQTNYWRVLSTDLLTRPSRLIQTTADLAFSQVQSLFAGAHDNAGSNADGVLLAIPAGYSREQLGLLLGVVNETGVPVAGLVDAALAACSHEPAPPRVLHLDLELHQALLTVLEYVGGERPGLKRSRFEIAQRHGLLALQQAAMRFIADSFVRKTRFDPLHEAVNEQTLLDQLPQWLAQLATEASATITIKTGERTLEVELERGEFIAAVEQHYVELLRLVQSARVAGMPIALRVSQRVATFPGLLERFAALRDCEVEVLPQGAAALGALKYADAIRRPPESLALVYQLPIPPTEGVAALLDDQSTPPQLRPTHVLFQGRAWTLSERPLTVGWATDGVQRSLVLPAAAPGISRSHCTLSRRNGSVVIEDHSTYGSFVNDERVVGRTALTVGDRLRLGSPGVTLELIQLVQDDGAPQD